jgi:hypothetical protein
MKYYPGPGLGDLRKTSNIINIDVQCMLYMCVHSTTSGSGMGPIQPPMHWITGSLSPEVKRPGLEADHSPLSSAEVKNGGVIPPLFHMSSRHIS